jgi:type II secretory pathway pseudopilin PulG
MRRINHSAFTSCQASLRVRRVGFTVVELLVSMLIVGLLLALLLPALSGARESSRRTQCMGNLRNLSVAMTSFETSQRRLPASGNWGHDPSLNSYPFHTWAVTVLPYLEQSALYNRWDLDRPVTDPVNEPLSRSQIAVYQCPSDISLLGKGDLSYAVNGGVGYTTKHSSGTRDVPVDNENRSLDLNGDGIYPHDTTQTGSSPSDRDLFKRMGLFFMETWNTNITKRHHSLADVSDGLSHTIMLAENVRVGADPAYARGSFANPDPLRCAFYLPDPCRNQQCDPGGVSYLLSNMAPYRINSGLTRPEGDSPVPNSFHPGIALVAFGDGSVRVLNDSIDGPLYSALVSPQGAQLQGLPLQQVIVGDEF